MKFTPCLDCGKKSELFSLDKTQHYCKNCRNQCCRANCFSCNGLFPVCQDCQIRVATLVQYRDSEDESYYCTECRYACHDCCDIYPIQS